MNQVLISTITVCVIALTSCGERAVTINPPSPLPTNPQAYLWSGGTGNTYVYQGRRTLKGNAGQDTTDTYTETFVITSRIDGNEAVSSLIRMSGTSTFESSFRMFTETYEASVTKVFQRYGKDTSIVLQFPLKAGQVFRNPYDNTLYTIVSVDERVTVPSGTYRCMKIERSGVFTTTLQQLELSTPKQQFIGKETSWYAPGYFLIQRTIEAIDTTQLLSEKWSAYTNTYQLISTVVK